MPIANGFLAGLRMVWIFDGKAAAKLLLGRVLTEKLGLVMDGNGTSRWNVDQLLKMRMGCALKRRSPFWGRDLIA
jgi:hypothetical protein